MANDGSPQPSTSQAIMANDGPRSNDSVNTNPTFQLHKPSRTPTTSSPLDVSNTHLLSQQTSSRNTGSLLEIDAQLNDVINLGNLGNRVKIVTQYYDKKAAAAVVNDLITLLRMENDLFIVNFACKCLTFMSKSRPLLSDTVAAIPVVLQVIQRKDVAEDSFTALKMFSRRHSKAILRENGVPICSTKLESFSINGQRRALATIANCCLNLQPEEFHFVKGSLLKMAQLLTQQDEKCVESVSTAFHRLIERFQHDPHMIQEIAKNELLEKCVQFLVFNPVSVLNSRIFTNVIRMLSALCANCPDLAITLLKTDIASTLLYLLTGSTESSQAGNVELVSRSPLELYEITCLIGELMPRLPYDVKFNELFQGKNGNEHNTEIITSRLRPPRPDARTDFFEKKERLAAEFIQTFFSVLLKVYSTSVEYKCQRALLRMVYYASTTSTSILNKKLQKQSQSSHISGMMASNDLRIVVGALQMAEILMQKLPKLLIDFRHDGLMHQVNLLATSLTTTFGSASNLSLTEEKAQEWIREQATLFVTKYEKDVDIVDANASTDLSTLTAIIHKLDGSMDENIDDCVKVLSEVRDILIKSDISPFEINHSGLIKSMLVFMAKEQAIISRDDRVRVFLNVFAELPLVASGPVQVLSTSSFSAFVAKMNDCVTQLEQFPVKVYDFPVDTGTNESAPFNTPQLKCRLQRHPECTNLRQWSGDTVEIDPLASIEAIERYLVALGYGNIQVGSEDDSDEIAAVALSQAGFKRKLQLLIRDLVLPYNMTIYQAVKNLSSVVNDQSKAPIDAWAQVHIIYYRPIEDKQMVDIDDEENFHVTVDIDRPLTSPLTQFLTSTLPSDVTALDPSLDAICLLRIVNALHRHWMSLYDCGRRVHIINKSEFIHSKIAAKANFLLQDPLVVMTKEIPQWLQQLVTTCPFLFTFETRYSLDILNKFEFVESPDVTWTSKDSLDIGEHSPNISTMRIACSGCTRILRNANDNFKLQVQHLKISMRNMSATIIKWIKMTLHSK